jgi:hypothetical protein
MTLASSANLPVLSAGQVMPLTLNDAATGLVFEIVYVTAIAGTSLTVTRAQEGTTARNWQAGDLAFVAPTAQTLGFLAKMAGVQASAYNFATDTGSANIYAAAYLPAITGGAVADGMLLGFKSAHANTGASTFSPNGLGPWAIYGGAFQPLQGGEINGNVWLEYNSSLNSGGGAWVIISSAGGTLQVGNATQTLHALNKAVADARYVLQSLLSATAATGKVPIGDSAGILDSSWLPSAPSLLADTGYKLLPDANSPSGYFIMQWGSHARATGVTTVTFPVAFGTACLNVQTITTLASQTVNADEGYQLLSKSTSQFEVWYQEYNNVNIGSDSGFEWFAIGY